MDHRLIIKNIKEGKFEKIYFLHGEEPYFIDLITNAIVENAMEEHERDFNQVILYGKEAEPPKSGIVYLNAYFIFVPAE